MQDQYTKTFSPGDNEELWLQVMTEAALNCGCVTGHDLHEMSVSPGRTMTFHVAGEEQSLARFARAAVGIVFVERFTDQPLIRRKPEA